MNLRVKFRVVQVTESDGGKDSAGQTTATKMVRLLAVHENTPENKALFVGSASGSVDLNCCLPEAVKNFGVGDEFQVEFSRVEASKS